MKPHPAGVRPAMAVAGIGMALMASGCAGSGLSTSSKCADYNDASRNDQVRWLQKHYGPNQANHTLNLRQVAEASEVMGNECGTNPDRKLGDINYNEQMAP